MVGLWVGIPTLALLLGGSRVGVSHVAWHGEPWEHGRMSRGIPVG